MSRPLVSTGAMSIGAIALLLTVPTMAQATDPAAQDAHTLPTISVTAKGHDADVLLTPAAVTIVDRDELRRRGTNNLGDALRGLPGLAVASDSPQGQNPVIRGLKKEGVVLLINGVRLNSAQPVGAIGSLLSLGLAERVEVVKGPASVLYGTGALGGAINVLMPQARFDEELSLEAAAGFDSASRGVRGTSVINVSGGNHALMLGASLARIGDYDAPDNRVAQTGYDSNAFVGQYRFRVNHAQQLRLSLQQHTDKDVWYPGSTRPHHHPQVETVIMHSPETERRLVEFGYSWQGLGDLPLNLDARVYRQEVQRQIFAREIAPLNRNITEARVTFATNGVDLKVDWLAHPDHLLSLGVNAWRMKASPERLLLPPLVPPALSQRRDDPFRDGRIEALGFYLQNDMQFGKLNVLAGLRHDTVEGNAAAVGNPPVTTGLDRSDSEFSGSVGLIYEVQPLLRPYASLSRGFRAGEMRERFEASPRGDGFFYLGKPQIQPEIATQFELGVKGGNDILTYMVSAYHNRITNYITGQLTGQRRAGMDVKQTINLGEVVIKGFEIQARWQFINDQWISFSYSRLRGDNRDLNEPLFQMPADELSFGWEGALASNLTADATLRLVRRQDRVATVFARGTENSTPGFATADIGVNWRYAPGQSLRFGVINLADKKYHEHLTVGISGQEIKAPGRSFQLAWRGSF